jgi:uncharacterized protein YecE (DUF72 family)
MQLRIGISGWTYAPWRGVFYPPDLPHKRELAFASRQLNSIEINGSFYSLQIPGSYKTWFEQTPDEFVFAVKGGRFITHMKKLKDVRIPLANFFASGVVRLNQKLGPILWQFPPGFAFNEQRFDEFFRLLPRTTRQACKLARENNGKLKAEPWLKIDRDRPMRYAVEIRHESFRSPRFIELLKRHEIALCIADAAGKWPFMDDVTADFVYIRLHGDEQLYVSGYTDDALDAWASRIKKWTQRKLDVYCYFDNDVKVRAPLDAINLSKRLGLQAGQMGGSFDFVPKKLPNMSSARDSRWRRRAPRTTSKKS